MKNSSGHNSITKHRRCKKIKTYLRFSEQTITIVYGLVTEFGKNFLNILFLRTDFSQTCSVSKETTLNRELSAGFTDDNAILISWQKRTHGWQQNRQSPKDHAQFVVGKDLFVVELIILCLLSRNVLTNHNLLV